MFCLYNINDKGVYQQIGSCDPKGTNQCSGSSDTIGDFILKCGKGPDCSATVDMFKASGLDLYSSRCD